ncbi:anhydro-N-acetylmuramic acid kinase [Musicola paradisiaca]|uniref:Anhydro-N-acetylmuramic acid kinase n=1 Tax=Musicola paradisiaca (strain Ech703) TaxID=579405 RepID=C6C4B4_MUSP7|nr:anhydro-N-acetylmuramic acid kinase [Musicola paradisiaca]ACS85488.1 protein of unknown function UPF0075 [Musicola paradisiaca Ech703]
MRAGKYIGIMSGTSLDGVDVVLADINARSITQLASYFHPMPESIRQAILSMNQGQAVTLSALGHLDTRLGVLFGDAVLQLLAHNRLGAGDIVAIGCHGQTMWHEPYGDAPCTLQIGDNNHIAAMTGITTVGDFRRRDVALGGQGAPLVPAFHHALLQHPTERRVVVNIGGIANLSLLFPGEPILGYDTGPGNMLMDAWVAQHRALPFDKDAVWAMTGRICPELLAHFLGDSYFSLSAPKSTGREYFNLAWLEKQLAAFSPLAVEDVQATLAALTANSIAEQIRLHGRCDRVLVCGGGARNPLLMQQLAGQLPMSHVSATDEYGIRGDDMEALAFAWLAFRTMSGLAGNLPSVTGARNATVLGAIFPANRSA